jgi:REP element-mobilizing transposase RayT
MPYARKDKITWAPGHFYHIFNRGARHLTIFREADNYLFVLRRVKKYAKALQLTVIAYCLMPNHYHFLVRQDGDQPSGLLPQRVFNSYSKAYNKRYEHSGTLFEQRYQAKHVENDRYLLHLSRYIHANPVKDGLVAHPNDWPYSNYAEWVGQRDGTLVDKEFVRQHFSSSEAYQEFVIEHLQTRDLPEEIQAYLDSL